MRTALTVLAVVCAVGCLADDDVRVIEHHANGAYEHVEQPGAALPRPSAPDAGIQDDDIVAAAAEICDHWSRCDGDPSCLTECEYDVSMRLFPLCLD